MGDHNSLVSYTNLVVELIHDIADSYPGSRTEADKCADVIRARVSKEGLKFLTVTLPSFGRAVDTALSKGIPLAVPYLRKKKGSSNPLLLGWLTERIFAHDGVELEKSDSRAVRHLRQILYFLYKVPIKHDQQSEDRTIRSFVVVDEEIARPLPTDVKNQSILNVARAFIARTVGSIDYLNIDPRHGPGAVATGEKPWQKYEFKRRYALLESVYPFDRYFYLGDTHLCDRLQEFMAREELDSGTAKVVLVPKDSRGPRLISCEPLEYQWMQQGLAEKLVTTLQSSYWTSGHVNFTDQSVNQRLACKGSIDSSLVTLDMKDASDRVSFQLVADLFPEGLMEALYALRTTHTMLPDGTIHRLNKFAPMGSALCFPVESLVFFALSVASLVVNLGYSMRKASRRVWVYGDDIVCYREDYSVILSTLPEFHLVFNDKKCCTHGFFRESCGGDFHKGLLVTPLRLKRVLSSLSDPATVVSLVDLSNRLYEHGYKRCALVLERLLRGKPIPYEDTQGNPGYLAFTPQIRAYNHETVYHPKIRYNPNLQCMEKRALTLQPRVFTRKRLDWEEVFRCTQTYTLVGSFNETKGARAGQYTVPHRIALKMRWIGMS